MSRNICSGNDNRAVVQATGYKRTQYACFVTSFSTAVTGNLTPLLFLTFRSMYGLSFTLLGLLVVINFGTQLAFDLLFSFFSDKLPHKLCVRLMPAIMMAGFILFGLVPYLFPGYEYIGLVLGTVVFSCGSGLSEVLTSPTVAALPVDHPERVLSRLHSCYAWGMVFVVLVSTVYIYLFGAENWNWLAVLFALLPLTATLLFIGAPVPDMESEEQKGKSQGLFKNKTMWLCFICIFLGGASECTMSQWCSGYLEQALGISKVWGDVFGVALFGAALGLGRSLYGRIGKNIINILIAGSCGATVCYVVAVLSLNPIPGLIACALTGFCVSMLWPGSLIATAERIPEGGVTMYALMAAGGDLGASVCPQLVGIIADFVIANEAVSALGAEYGMAQDQIAMRAGLAIAILFPLCAILCFTLLKRRKIPLKG